MEPLGSGRSPEEKFILDRFVGADGSRLYASGDLARWAQSHSEPKAAVKEPTVILVHIYIVHMYIYVCICIYGYV